MHGAAGGQKPPFTRRFSFQTAVHARLIDVVAISDDPTVVHFWSRVAAGAAHPAGPHAVDALILAVLKRQAGEWRIKALENVTLTNPRTAETVLRDSRCT